MKVLGIGNALVDVLAHIETDDLLDTLALPKGSMQLIDEEKFKLVSTESNKLNRSIVSGGSASNTIVGLACLGVETGFIGRVGSDFYANHYTKDITKYGVRSHLIHADEPSGVASTFISTDGERTFGTFLGAAAKLQAEDLNPKDFEGYDYCYIEGYLLQNHNLIKRAIELAHEAGAKVVVDLASYNIVEENQEFLSRIVPQSVDILFANEEEAKAKVYLEPEKAVSEIAKMVDISIVKEGQRGSWIQRGDEKVFVSTHNTVTCIDTTGAGDLYASGFMYGLLHDAPLNVCAQVGTLTAEAVIQVVGSKIHANQWVDLKISVDRLMKK